MPRVAAKSAAPLVLVCGDDEFGVKQRAREIFQAWTAELAGIDYETLDASAANVAEALRALARLREALQTLPFFGSSKVIWFKDCNFLGDERTAGAQDVIDVLLNLADELKAFRWDNVRLLISAGKADKRKTFFKTLDKLGQVELFESVSTDSKNWVAVAESRARSAVRARGKDISSQALSELVSRLGANTRLLDSEAEKLSLFIGARTTIEVEDVEAICTRNKMARAFALGDALGDRDLPRLLRRLDEELWDVKLDPRKTEIGLLYGLISKVRAILLLQEMLREGWIRPRCDYESFKNQLERIPHERLPSDKRFNPLALNPYVLFKALPQAANYTQAELVTAMELLLVCNLRLVGTGLDEALVLQQTLVQIVGEQATARSR